MSGCGAAGLAGGFSGLVADAGGGRQAHDETGIAHLPLPDVLQQIFHIIPMFGLLRGRR